MLFHCVHVHNVGNTCTCTRITCILVPGDDVYMLYPFTPLWFEPSDSTCFGFIQLD